MPNATGLGIGNKQFEDEAAVVRTDAHGALAVGGFADARAQRIFKRSRLI